MMAGVKSLAKDTAIYGVSSIVGRFLNWCLVPLYTIMFVAEQYGMVTYLYSFVALALIILTYGMETGFFRFANNESYSKPTEVYTTSLISLASTSTIFFVAVLLFLQPISDALKIGTHSDYIWILALTVAIDAFTAIPFAYLRYKKRPLRFAYLKLVGIGLNIGFNLFFIILCPWLMKICPESISWFYNPEYGIGYIFVANLVSTVATLILLFPELTSVKYRFNGELLKKMFIYSFPLLVLGIAGIMNQTIDKILFPYLIADQNVALTELGIYGANYKIAIVMVMFIQAFRFAYEPFIFAQNKEQGANKNKAYIDAMKYFIIFGLLIFLVVMFYLDILKYFIAPSYFSGLRVVPIIMLAELFFGIFFNLSLWYKLTDKTQWGMYFSFIGLAMTVGLNVILVPRFGYIGCAWAAFACYFTMMIISYFVGKNRYPIRYDLRSAFFYFAVAGVLYGAATLVTIESEVLRLGYRTILLAIFIAIIIKKEPLNIPFLKSTHK
ncbi:MAG: polysaccharide biosynthesis C-terminal domain-containing protein [Muribaculaceae bacterium]